MPSEKHVAELFAEINKAEPLALIDMPDLVDGAASPKDREIITKAAEALKSSNAAMFKPSRGCRAPHLNVDALRDEIHKVGLASRFETHELLSEWLQRRDRELSKLPREVWHSRISRSRATSKAQLDKALDKAKANEFYLGLTWEWTHSDEP